MTTKYNHTTEEIKNLSIEELKTLTVGCEDMLRTRREELNDEASKAVTALVMEFYDKPFDIDVSLKSYCPIRIYLDKCHRYGITVHYHIDKDIDCNELSLRTTHSSVCDINLYEVNKRCVDVLNLYTSMLKCSDIVKRLETILNNGQDEIDYLCKQYYAYHDILIAKQTAIKEAEDQERIRKEQENYLEAIKDTKPEYVRIILYSYSKDIKCSQFIYRNQVCNICPENDGTFMSDAPRNVRQNRYGASIRWIAAKYLKFKDGQKVLEK